MHTELAAVVAYIMSHKLGCYITLAASIGQLPMPTLKSSGFYRWFFGTANILASNIRRGVVGFNGGATFDPYTGERLKDAPQANA